MRLINKLSVLFLIILVCNSCTKSSILGSDIIDQNKQLATFTDTIGLIGTSEAIDSVLVFEDSITSFRPQFLSLANIADPVFGKTIATIYSQLTADVLPNFKNPTVDSAFLYLAYPKTGTKFYGDTSVDMLINIYRLKDDLSGLKKLNSNISFDIEPTPIGTLNYKVTPNIVQPKISSDSFYVKIPIEPSFYKLLLDTTIYTNQTVFEKWMKGIVIKSETTSKCGVFFDMYPTNSITSLRLYYKNTNDTFGYTAIYKPSNVKFNTFKIDRSGAPVNDFTGNAAKGDSLLFLQGTSGIDVKFQFPSIKNFSNIAINKAELILPLRDNPSDLIPIQQLWASFKNTDNKFSPIPDIVDGGNAFEGKVDLKDGQYFYRLNISKYIQKVISEGLKPEIYISALSKQQNLNRSILQGVKNSKGRAKLNLIYTNY